MQGGARCVKIFIEDGFGSRSDWPMMSKATLARIRHGDSQASSPLIAHANALDMQRIALDTGVDVIAHGLWNWNESDGAAWHSCADRRAPAQIARQGHRLPGDAARTARNRRHVSRDTLKDPMYAKVVPPAVLAWYATHRASGSSR